MLSQGRYSAQELANHFQVEMVWIVDDINHIRRSIQPRELVMEPPVCQQCGFTYKERSRIKRPSRCPRCKHERIKEPLFHIR